MENQTEKTNNDNDNLSMINPPKSAYLWLAGIFAIMFAVIYIGMLLGVHFFTVSSGNNVMSKTSANLMFAVLLLAVLATMYMYIIFSRKELLFNLKIPAALSTIFAVVAIANIFISYLNPYAMLLSLTALWALPFCKKRDAFVLNTFSTLVAAFMLIDIMDDDTLFAVAIFVAIAGLVGGAIGAYSFPNAMTRTASILRAFVTVAAVMALLGVMLSAYSLDVQPFIDNIIYIGVSAAGQLMLSVVLVPIVESVFNIVTDYKLVELTNHKSPLIHRLSVEAPGTFNHCMAVANFAEICANAIGEDPYLARACAYYHDMGKLNNAMYFTENQAGYNPHDDILPEVSAEIIRQHTIDGYNICKENRIPEEVARVTIEHHGTLPIVYFFNKAKTLTDGEVDMADYRYRGKTPTSKIAAILMICDSAEAAIRAMDNPDGERVNKLLSAMIDERIKLGQFANCDITMRDLNAVRGAIVGAFGGLYHKRIKYGGRGDAHV
ncbi:MAG: HDIG domain-containing protein [Clostridiales bacterium]|nr:HDIG domain-containing protein [Clostridiales bacterium]